MERIEEILNEYKEIYELDILGKKIGKKIKWARNIYESLEGSRGVWIGQHPRFKNIFKKYGKKDGKGYSQKSEKFKKIEKGIFSEAQKNPGIYKNSIIKFVTGISQFFKVDPLLFLDENLQIKDGGFKVEILKGWLSDKHKIASSQFEQLQKYVQQIDIPYKDLDKSLLEITKLLEQKESKYQHRMLRKYSTLIQKKINLYAF